MLRFVLLLSLRFFWGCGAADIFQICDMIENACCLAPFGSGEYTCNTPKHSLSFGFYTSVGVPFAFATFDIDCDGAFCNNVVTAFEGNTSPKTYYGSDCIMENGSFTGGGDYNATYQGPASEFAAAELKMRQNPRKKFVKKAKGSYDL